MPFCLLQTVFELWKFFQCLARMPRNLPVQHAKVSQKCSPKILSGFFTAFVHYQACIWPHSFLVDTEALGSSWKPSFFYLSPQHHSSEAVKSVCCLSASQAFRSVSCAVPCPKVVLIVYNFKYFGKFCQKATPYLRGFQGRRNKGKPLSQSSANHQSGENIQPQRSTIM